MKQEIQEKKLDITPKPLRKHTRYFLGDTYPGIYFTEREFQVATHIGSKKYREIAALYQLSERTIEYYVTTIKYKLRCTTKIELISKLNVLGIPS